MHQIKQILSYLQSKQIEYVFKGDDTVEIKGFSGLNHYQLETMTWIKDRSKLGKDLLLNVPLTLVITSEAIDSMFTQNQIIVKNSKQVFFSLVEWMAEGNKLEGTEADQSRVIGINTFIGKEVSIGKGVKIGANCVLDGNIQIGDYTTIGNNVVISYKVEIGKYCEIQSGAIIGEQGFSYWEKQDEKIMVKHFGGVKIEDHVRIGANTCIVRGTIDNTVIGEGTKIDNLCHIAHNCQIGKNCIIIAGATLCGSVHLEDNVYISTAVVRQQLHIGRNTLVGLGAVVVKEVPEHTVVIGNPARVMDKK